MRLKKGPKFYIQAANGVVSSDRYAIIVVPGLGSMKALALKDSPDLLSMGNTIEEFQTIFVWDYADYENPFLLVRGGSRIKLKLDRNVPILDLSQVKLDETFNVSNLCDRLSCHCSPEFSHGPSDPIKHVSASKRIKAKSPDPEFVGPRLPDEHPEQDRRETREVHDKRNELYLGKKHFSSP